MDMFLNLNPQTMFVLSNFIEASIFGDGYEKILKIVPIPQDSISKYVTLDFDVLEYLPLQHIQLRELDFELKTSSGGDLRFIRNNLDIVYISLMFKRFN